MLVRVILRIGDSIAKVRVKTGKTIWDRVDSNASPFKVMIESMVYNPVMCLGADTFIEILPIGGGAN
jgi:hypothetical protein